MEQLADMTDINHNEKNLYQFYMQYFGPGNLNYIAYCYFKILYCIFVPEFYEHFIENVESIKNMKKYIVFLKLLL